MEGFSKADLLAQLNDLLYNKIGDFCEGNEINYYEVIGVLEVLKGRFDKDGYEE